MRMRLLVPRSGRGRGLGGLAALGLLVAAVLVVAGRGEDEPREQTPQARTATPTPEPARFDAPTDGPSLAVGVTEQNPNLLEPIGPGSDTAPWTTWRDALTRVDPAVYRLLVVWYEVQPGPDAPPNLAVPQTGCMRERPPCAAFNGVRDQLVALAARQREGGWEGLVTITGTPEWAAGSASGCPGSRQTGAPRPDALPAYRQLLAAIFALADEVGASLRYVSPWNEPNHPYFLSPQRQRCDAAAAPRAVAPYGRLVRAAQAEMGDDRELVLGEAAGVVEPQARALSVGELIRGLPRDVVCDAPVWSQHGYIGGRDPVAAATAALDARGCPRPHAVWITETGVGTAPSGLSFAARVGSEREGCRLLHARMSAWYENPRVTVAMQYTMREDHLFPTGLVTTDLARARAALGEWQAWGSRPSFDAPPPNVNCAG
jgi:hypothetical protein